VDQAVQTIVDILVSRAEMLEEYFALKIDTQGRLITLPLLLRDYTPNLDKLPLFLMRLGPQVSSVYYWCGHTLTVTLRWTGRLK
jgi:DNA mismatch repair protein MLH1